MRSVVRLLRSMRFAIAVLLLLGIGSALGTFLPQNEPADFYQAQYGNTIGPLLVRTGLTNVFTAPWFLVLVVLLCVSLLLCVVFRAGALYRDIRAGLVRKRTTQIGSWLLHTGILVIIVFFAIGNATAYQSEVRNIPGTVTPVPNTPFTVAMDDFAIHMRDDGSVDSYVTDVRIEDASGLRAQSSIRVNHPLTVDGYQFSQSATGYALHAHIERDGNAIGDAVLFQSEYVSADQDALVLTLLQLYPDYVPTPDGPATQSVEINNPYALYRAYYRGEDLGARLQPMNAPVSVGEYRFVFTDPQMYSVLSVRKDSFAIGTGIGAVVLLAGIALVFVMPQKSEEESHA